MKALIREPGETVTESDGIAFIDWKTGAPLTNPDWFGGPYRLVDDYVPEDPDADFVPADDGATHGCINPSAASQPADPTPAAKVTVNPDGPVPVGDTIVIDGVTYIRKSQDQGRSAGIACTSARTS